MDRDALIHMAASFLDGIDSAVETAKEASGRKQAGFACGPGCAHCCRLPVDATYPEGMLVAEYIRNHLPDNIDNIRKRLDAWARWSRTALVDMLADGMDPVRAFLYHGPGCPFLVGGMCEVYPVRPAGCRVHVSVKSPAECMPPVAELPVFFNPGSVRAVNEAVRPVIMDFMRGLDAAGMDISRPVEPMALVVTAMMLQGTATCSCRRWP